MFRRTAVALVTLALVAMVPSAAAAQSSGCVGEHTTSEERVAAPDGVEHAITIFRSGWAECGPVPVVLHQHGWAGTRAQSVDATLVIPGDLQALLDAGYGVVSIDARGHGDSGGQAAVLHPEYELAGYTAILDHIHDEFDWVIRSATSDIDKDIVVGAYGASYGGGFQTLIASFDRRLDAMIPVVTWYDLPRALAPSGVLRSLWGSLLVAAGEGQAELDPRLRQWYLEVQATNQVPEDAEIHFRESSPSDRPGAMRTPALVVQGTPDTLFTLVEGIDLHRELRESGVESWFIGVNTGHILPGLQPTGLGAPAVGGTDGCVQAIPHVLAFLDAFLLEDAHARSYMDGLPRAALMTEQGGCVAAEDWPVADTTTEIEVGPLAVPEPAGTLLVPLFTAAEETVLAGLPRLRATAAVELDDIVFASLALGDPGEGGWIIDDQVTPIRTRIGEVGGELDVELGGISTVVPEGTTVFLRLEGANEQFITNQRRAPGALLLEDVVIELPHATQGTTDPFDTYGRDRTPRQAEEESADRPAGSDRTLPATGGGAGLAVLGLGLAALTRRRPAGETRS